jgi:hypothetical protein
MESSSLNDYILQVLFGSYKAPLLLAERECLMLGQSICINAERMPLETKLAAYFVPGPIDSASWIASSWLFWTS